jgi:AsmA protein
MALGRPVNWILAVVVVVLIVLAATALLLPRLLDTRSIAARIASEVKTLTGRTMTLGTISFRILPVPAVQVAPVTLGEGARYPGRDFVRLKSLEARLRLWPLFGGRVEIASLVFQEPTVTLIRDRQGRWNFDDLLERLQALESSAASSSGAPASPGGAPATASPGRLGIARAEIHGGRLVLYDDAVVPGRRSELRLGPVDAGLAGWGVGRRTTADLSVALGKSRLQAEATLEGKDEAQVVAATMKSSRVEAGDLRPLLPWLGIASPAGLDIGGTVTLDGRASIPLASPAAVQFEGTAALDNLHYKDASMKGPVEHVGGKLRVSGARAEWDPFTATLGTSEVHGRMSVENYLKPRIGFDLASKRLDLNQLLDRLGAGGPTAAAPASAAGRQAGAPPTATPAAQPAAGPEAGLLAQVSGRGTLNVDALRFQTFDLSGVRGTVTLANGVLSLGDFAAGLYGGSLRGEAALDLSRRVPGYRLQTDLEGVDVNAAATAFDPSLKDILRGRLGGKLGLTANGAAFDAILGSARGTAAVGINDGAITSISILKQLAALLEMAGGKGIGRDETPFKSLAGSFVVGDRKARTSDLHLDSTDLDITGAGDLGLDASLDLGLTARFSEEASRGMLEKNGQLRVLADKDGRVVVHLLAKGPLAKPQVALDTRQQVKQLQEQKKQEVKDKVRSRLLDMLGGGEKKKQPPPPPPPPR